MTQVPSGLLPALIAYYQRLETDPGESVAEYGFSREKIHFAVVLEPDGSLFGLNDIRERNEKGKPIPSLHLVPDGGGRAGIGLKPFFCWDNTGYALGRDNKDKPERAAAMFAEFRKLHLAQREELAGDEGFTALCRFLEQWDPARAEEFPNWEEAAGQNVVFKVRGRTGYVHGSEAVRSVWLKCIAAPGEEGSVAHGISLISGAEEELARLHPQISGVVGANTTGAAIVSFNLAAFESYGKSQSYNAPVGVRDAFRYSTALNRLLADGLRRARIGDATVVFWSDHAEGSEAEEMFNLFFGDQLSHGDPSEHAATVDRVRGFLSAASQGRLGDLLKKPDAPFFILGLSPNASRLNVRYWLAGTVGQFAQRLARHASDLRIEGAPDIGDWFSIQSLLAETAREKSEIQPQLAGNVSRAILEGLPSYPEALLTGIIRRIRADGEVSWCRAAVLKAFLKREGRFEVDVYLNKEHREKAYHCGRLFAVLSFAQKEALGDINSGVIRRNLGSVMAMPGIMLGRLEKAAEVGHLPKLDGDLPEFIRDELKAINVRLGDDLPRHLSLHHQGLFMLGFYQESQYLDSVSQQVKQRFGQKKRWRTAQGEWVRSRLEVRVANTLGKYKFEYTYEPTLLLQEGDERWPDFVVRRGPSRDLFIEVLGMDTPEYNHTWAKKEDAYRRSDITRAGGLRGHLIVLDFRQRPFDESVVYDSLRPYMTVAEENSTQHQPEADYD